MNIELGFPGYPGFPSFQKPGKPEKPGFPDIHFNNSSRLCYFQDGFWALNVGLIKGTHIIKQAPRAGACLGKAI